VPRLIDSLFRAGAWICAAGGSGGLSGASGRVAGAQSSAGGDQGSVAGGWSTVTGGWSSVAGGPPCGSGVWSSTTGPWRSCSAGRGCGIAGGISGGCGPGSGHPSPSSGIGALELQNRSPRAPPSWASTAQGKREGCERRLHRSPLALFAICRRGIAVPRSFAAHLENLATAPHLCFTMPPQPVALSLPAMPHPKSSADSLTHAPTFLLRNEGISRYLVRLGGEQKLMLKRSRLV
jgi:hypothetical protein